jgi:hypothetical protein
MGERNQGTASVVAIPDPKISDSPGITGAFFHIRTSQPYDQMKMVVSPAKSPNLYSRIGSGPSDKWS